MINGDPEKYFDSGKVLVAAANPEMMDYYIDRGDLVILGNRPESQRSAIEKGASCLIICEGSNISEDIKELAEKQDTVIIITAYDAFTTARLINQSMEVILNIEADHLDYFKNLDNIRASFHKFTKRLPDNGTVIINDRIKDYGEIVKDFKGKVVTFGSKDAHEGNA